MMQAHPESAYLKAFLLRIRESLTSTSQLRRFLLKHPLLVIELGFQLILDPSAPYGFDAQQTLPCEQWLRQKLRTFDQALLQALLQATVRDLQAEIPSLGEVVAFDIKHIYAWVKENNPRVYVKDRYDKERRLAGDPDCRLGVKRSTNRAQADGTTTEKTVLTARAGRWRPYHTTKPSLPSGRVLYGRHLPALAVALAVPSNHSQTLPPILITSCLLMQSVLY